MTQKINIGLIGLGRLGSIYANYLTHRLTNATLLAVAARKQMHAKALAQELGVAKWYKNYQDLITDKEIDAVVVVTPTFTHKEIVIEAAKHDKAIFCEKPLSLSLEEAQAMLQTIENTGVFFQMAFVRRFDKGYVTAKQKIDDGVIGAPLVFKSSSRDPYRPELEFLDPKNSGGIFIDMGIHDFDIARWFMGEIKSVYSIGGILVYPEMKNIGDVDNGITNLYFVNGSLGVVDLSRSGIYGYDIRTEVLGTKGTLKIGYLRETPILVMTSQGVTHDTVPYFMERFGDAYIAQLQDFVENVLHDKEPSITCADGLSALQISLSAKLSFEENRLVEVQELNLSA